MSETIARLKQFNLKSLIHKQNILPAVILIIATVLVGYNVSNASGSTSQVTDHPNNLLYDYLEKDVVTEKASDAADTASYQTVATLASAMPQTVSVVTDTVSYQDDSDPELAVSLAGQVLEKPISVTSDNVTHQRDKIIDHVVQAGETLGTIAQAYNLKLSTVLWANNMNTGTTVKPGWGISILPVDGVKRTIQEGDTLDSLASKYKVNKDVIVAFNDLKGEQLPVVGTTIVIPDGTDSASLDPAPTPAPTVRVASKSSNNDSSNDDVVVRRGSGRGHVFPYGFCTYWAAKQYGGVEWGGNANQWLRNAKAYGHAEGKTPKKGAIYVEPWLSAWGHVSYVTSVGSNGSFTVSEMNYAGWARVSYRTIGYPSGTFIY